MKIWYHVLAALVGLAISALIVWFVFGSASEEGATQEGSAGALSSESLCGTITPAEANSPETRARAADNLPVLANELGPIAAVSEDRPEQKAWFARVHAAGGLCVDEITVDSESMVTIRMSTVDDVTEAQAGLFAAGAIAQAFTPPLQRPKVTLIATVDGSDRRVVVSRRAWNAFQLARESRNQPLNMRTLAQFRRTTSFSPADLRIVGWG